MESLIGTGVALVTPFKKNGEVDFLALENLVKFQIENGVNYLVILGTTGEPATLTKEEKDKVIQTIITTNDKRLPLVIGIGGNNTKQVVADIKAMDLSPFTAILSVSPYYNKPTQEGIYQHFKAIANATEKPIILYNVPHRTGQNVAPETIVRLAEDCENIVAVKDAAGDINQTFSILKNRPKDFMVISGEDGLGLTSVLAGGSGVISVIGQAMPKKFTKMINLGLQNNAKEAYKIQFQLAKLTSLIFKEGNPAGVKCILKHKGIMDNMVRLPLIPASIELEKAIIKEVKLIQ
ncbi:MAG TPA: 4-hydroxy-tetrahydrodipicolinate synthase [Flavobacteriia bacterium]|nr:4-hydroxy-tetrahydrodipicolinate synthase [Flavobacteriia bacterium]